MSGSVEICVVGPVCRDRIELPGLAPIRRPGGVPSFSAPVYRALGLSVGVLTSVAPADADELVGPLRDLGIPVAARTSAHSASFVNTYDRQGHRSQQILATADPLPLATLDTLGARVAHLGPLVPDDLSPAVTAAIAERTEWIALDLQGLVRATGPHVQAAVLHRARDVARRARVVKASADEARLLTGETDPTGAARQLLTLGPSEALVTCGAAGAVVASADALWSIDALKPEHVGDPTGAGDVFLAAYVARRLVEETPERSGRFAAAAAAIQIETGGRFRADAAEIAARLER